MFTAGKLIIVSGRSGAGKTTLITFALKAFRNLEYLTTYTTREPRKGDIGYVYLSKDSYLQKMSSSEHWDHTEVHGNYYGADVTEVLLKLNSGINLVVTCYPSLEELENFKKSYKCDIKSIFIDISQMESARRLRQERNPSESSRIQVENNSINEHLVSTFDFLFKPTGEIKKDIESFNNLVHSICI